ncbi:hypothetical protein C2G38_2229724 [Gigaspora rosea]|uniref:Uncharacterized protein n=1 Tax=Gigaspora rosea TaxID=44941 RepID=A0A397TUI2_9GLOM|nr:hypothetical protein C2G38_2229724 [Gigaspora rosea]
MIEKREKKKYRTWQPNNTKKHPEKTKPPIKESKTRKKKKSKLIIEKKEKKEKKKEKPCRSRFVGDLFSRNFFKTTVNSSTTPQKPTTQTSQVNTRATKEEKNKTDWKEEKKIQKTTYRTPTRRHQ